ncbi:glycosyltransferase [Acinetobacter harbinensis]|uniref:glycosyltransferase n=1 Tax=Acinetobacter harbinensis TaxID=1353941 RepID=UPI001C4FE19C|nr:glycosyltransferase [Acinetobacter harbinensis]
MKVLHAVNMKHVSSGILNQMTWELESAKKLNLDWNVVFYVQEYNEKNSSKIVKYWDGNSRLNWVKFRQDYYTWLLEQSAFFDILVLRHSLSDPYQVAFLKKIKKPVYLVHHTLEIQEILSNNGIKSNIKAWVEKYFGRLSLEQVQGLVGVTNEIFNYENRRVNSKFKQKIIYPNGICYDNKILIDSRKNKIPELIFVASFFSSWHGVDLLLNALENTSEEFILHIVGRLNPKDEQQAKKDQRIVLHGHLSQLEIERLMSSMWLGLSSFALFRQNMKEACTLKVREYLKNGLPVYSGYKDVFCNSFPYYRIGEPNFDNILEYARKMRYESKEEISNLSKQYIDKEILLKNLYLTLAQNHNFTSTKF